MTYDKQGKINTDFRRTPTKKLLHTLVSKFLSQRFQKVAKSFRY